MTDQGNATMNARGRTARVTFLDWYGKSKLNCVVRLEEDCQLPSGSYVKAGSQYIAPTSTVKFDGNPPETSEASND